MITTVKIEDSVMNRIANPALMIKMLRDAGYKNTSYAVAELVDNSIEAKAKNISIALYEENVTNVRTQKLINEIAIFDDVEGMAPAILGRCLSFGWGTRLEGATGLGKFGFGLKGASISQARRVERLLILAGYNKAKNGETIAYFNRLSDYFFVLSRFINKRLSVDDVIWKP